MANYKDIKYQYPASAVTSGTLGSARISEASVTQHVAATDLQPIKSDITALAIREATNEASAAFNLPNQFIETFTDDTKLGTQTTGDRVSGYWATIYSSYGANASIDYWNPTQAGGGTDEYQIYNAGASADNGSWIDIVESGNTQKVDFDYQMTTHSGGWTWASSGTGNYYIIDYKESKRFDTYIEVGKNSGWGDHRGFRMEHSLNNSSYTAVDLSGITATTILGAANVGTMTGGGLVAGTFDSSGNFEIAQHATSIYGSSGIKITGFPQFDARYIKVMMMSQWGGTPNANAQSGILSPYHLPLTSATGATGTLIQAANTVASAKTKVGGVAFYKDNAGTATLGTDLKIYFSCNNGGAWTEAASYNAITPVYSTGVKQVRLGETTCTSGTGVIYKAVWANQAASSKETQLHGIGINY